MYEIVSAETDHGILKNTSGFCPVAITKGTPVSLLKPVFDLARRQAQQASEYRASSTMFASYFPIVLGGKKYSLITRGSKVDSQSDTPFVVHQLLLDQTNQKTAGPAAILCHDSNWITQWNTKSQSLKPRDFELPPLSPRICKNWEEVSGDSGWASAPIEAWENRTCCVLLTPPDLDSRQVLQLFVESQSLIPHEHRWHIPFSVGACHPFENDNRFWLAFDRGTQAAIDTLQRTDTVRIDLSEKLGRPSGKYSQEARSGSWIQLGNKHIPHSHELSSKVITEESSKASESGNRNNTSASTDRAPKQTPIDSTTPAVEKKKFRTKSEFEQDQASSSANINKPLSDNSERVNWAKISILAAGLTGLGLVIWFGLKNVNQLTSMMNSVEAPAVISGQPTDLPLTPTESQSKIPILPASTDSANTTGSISDTESIKLNNAFRNAQETMRWANLTVRPKEPQQKLFSIGYPANLISDYLELGIDTASQRKELVWNHELSAWILDDIAKKPIAKVFCLADATGDHDDGISHFYWQWINEPNQRVKFDEFRAGQLHFKIKGQPSPSFSIALSAPAIGEPFTTIDSLISTIKLTPPVSTYLCRANVYRLFKWEASAMQINDGFVNDGGIWLSPHKSESNDLMLVAMDTEVLRQKLHKSLNIHSDSNSPLNSIVDDLLDYHGPFGIEYRFDLASRENQFISISVKPRVLFESPGEDIAALFIRRPKGTSPDRAVAVGMIKERLVTGMMDHLGLGGPDARKIILGGGKACRSMKRMEDQAKTALGGIIFSNVCQMIDQPMVIQVSRTCLPKRQGDTSYTVVVSTFE